MSGAARDQCLGDGALTDGLSLSSSPSVGYVYQTVDGFVNNIAPDLFRLRMRGVMTMTQGPLAAKRRERKGLPAYPLGE